MLILFNGRVLAAAVVAKFPWLLFCDVYTVTFLMINFLVPQDQLLFCDDCDRGYHMYCLKPPMEKPPEGMLCWAFNQLK